MEAAFQNTSITSTPKMIVARNVTNFQICFHDCSSLTSIPQGLFDNCPKVTSFNSCFGLCISLTSIPQGLFDKCPEVTDFSWCFVVCKSLTSIPNGLFDKNVNVTDFSYCFYNDANITSALPDVWNKTKFPKVTDGSLYAYNCAKTANYNEVPADFK